MQANHLKKSLLALAISQLISHGAQAAQIEVNNAGDDGEGCTFREAVERINTAGAVNNNGCLSRVSAFGTRDSISFSVPSVTLKSEVIIEKDLAINRFTFDPPVTIKGDGSDGLFYIRNSNVTFNKATLTGGAESSGGGAIGAEDSTITLNNSTVQNNSADDGAGILAIFSSITLNHSTVQNNSANNSGGGILVGSGSFVALNDSSVLNNFASNGNGGGISISGASVQIANSTISGNTSGASGGGIGITSTASAASITNSTITGNSAASGGGLSAANQNVTLQNNLIVGNESSEAGSAEFLVTSQTLPSSNVRNNLIGSSYSIASTISDTNIILNADTLSSIIGPLADNGGPTLTHALREGSPAINAGDSEVCAAEPINNLDQRGELRGEPCFIGAVEFFEPDPEPDGTFFVVPTKNGKSVIVEL